ncbi:unnamed protein product [Rotaria sp. Silwood2]|nr:unnamed protein product [Rotaria sp. Silwood2]
MSNFCIEENDFISSDVDADNMESFDYDDYVHFPQDDDHIRFSEDDDDVRNIQDDDDGRNIQDDDGQNIQDDDDDVRNIQDDDDGQNIQDDDDDVRNIQDDDLMINAQFDLNGTEPTIELHIAKYICKANLDKTKTNQLLSLLSHVHNQDQLPPSSSNKLWKKLNIKLDYVKIQYCTNCMRELVPGSSCGCSKLQQPVVSELIIFSAAHEISRVLATIVEIPRPFRDNEQNTILLCLWHSSCGPTAEQLLDRIVNDLSLLLTTGIDIDIRGTGTIHFDLFIQGVCADGPGQSKITEMISHNGYYACRVCEFEGIYYDSDRTCTYPWSVYVQENPRFRTRNRFESCLNEAEYLKNTGGKNINVFGIKGVSPLNRLLFIPTQAIYDYFHLCLEGHMKVLLKEWNDMHSGTNIQTCEIIAQFDDFLCNIDYPHSIHRRVRCFRSFHDWKASQLRLFLIYLALPFLLFFNHYFPPLLIYHFSLYAIYIRILCHFNEKKNVYDSRVFIETHLRRFSEFYPMSKQLLSTHCNTHLWQQVIRHGSLTATSFRVLVINLLFFGPDTNNVLSYIILFLILYVKNRVASIYALVIVTAPKQNVSKMSKSTVSKNNASQRVIIASSTSATQYRSSSEYQSSSQHQTSSQQQPSSLHQHSSQLQSPSIHRSPNVRRSSNVHQPSYVRQPSDAHQSYSQTTNYFGPIRSSSTQNHSHTLTSSNSQQRASPYTTNSPRTIRGMPNREVNIQSDQCEEEFTRPTRLITVDENLLHLLLERSDFMENEIRTLNYTTNQILKIARQSLKDQELFPTSQPTSKLTPVFWNGENLIENTRTPLPTTFLCNLVRKMYTTDEIKSRVPQLKSQAGDERLEKIKECLVQLYFSQNPSLINTFMKSKGHDSLYWQERSQRSRDKSKARAAQNNNNNNNNNNDNNDNNDNNNNNNNSNNNTNSNQNVTPNQIHMNNNLNNFDVDLQIHSFDDI